MRKKKIFFHSDFALSNTGFGRNAKAVLSYLYSRDKYEILSYCCGLGADHSFLSQTPWKSVGALTSNYKELEFLKKNEHLFRQASYGSERLDEVITDFKPDVYIGVQDIWGVDYSVGKSWFPRISSAIWTTLDSLPILPSAVEMAPKIKNYWVWSEFATDALHKLGHSHVKTLHGAIETKDFYRLPNDVRTELRRRNNISSEDFIIGFVFRNQLRKSVPNLLDGFKKFKDELGEQVRGAKLLLHTNFSEGWNILRLASEYGVSHEDILTTLICKNCNAYSVSKFVGQGVMSCPVCGANKSMATTNIELGAKESQLNEIYNLMDVYCHPFTSGGQEIPIQEAKLTELITLVTNYSCGETMCLPEAYSIPLEFSEYREANTEFRKASTDPGSIKEGLVRVFKMSAEEKGEMGKAARQWALNNFSKEVVGIHLEEFIDSATFAKEEIFKEGKLKNPDAKIDHSLDDSSWLKSLYKEVLDRVVDENDEGFLHWKQRLVGTEDHLTRPTVENFFRQTATNELKSKIEFYLDKDDKGRRILFVLPHSASEIFLTTSLFQSAKETYPGNNIYVAAPKEYMPMLDGNPFVHKVIPYMEKMDDQHWLEGNSDHEGFFNVAFLMHLYPRIGYVCAHQGRDKVLFDTLR